MTVIVFRGSFIPSFLHLSILHIILSSFVYLSPILFSFTAFVRFSNLSNLSDHFDWQKTSIQSFSPSLPTFIIHSKFSTFSNSPNRGTFSSLTFSSSIFSPNAQYSHGYICVFVHVAFVCLFHFSGHKNCLFGAFQFRFFILFRTVVVIFPSNSSIHLIIWRIRYFKQPAGQNMSQPISLLKLWNSKFSC